MLYSDGSMYVLTPQNLHFQLLTSVVIIKMDSSTLQCTEAEKSHVGSKSKENFKAWINVTPTTSCYIEIIYISLLVVFKLTICFWTGFFLKWGNPKNRAFGCTETHLAMQNQVTLKKNVPNASMQMELGYRCVAQTKLDLNWEFSLKLLICP